MPYIPLPKENLEPPMPQVPRLVPEYSVSLDARGLFHAAAELGEASKLPIIDEQPFVAAAGSKGNAIGEVLTSREMQGALATVGQALAGVVKKAGSVEGAVAMKRQEESDRTGMLTALSMFDAGKTQAQGYFDKNAATPDGWIAETLRIGDRVLKGLGKITGMSFEGLRTLNAQGQRWHRELAYWAKAESSKQVFRNSADAQRTHFYGLLRQGKVDSAEAMVPSMSQSGVFHEAELQEFHQSIVETGSRMDEGLAFAVATDANRGFDLEDGHRRLAESRYIPKERKPALMEQLTRAHATVLQERYLSEETGKDPTDTLAKLRRADQFPLVRGQARLEAMNRAAVLQESEAQLEVSRALERIERLDSAKLADATLDSLGVSWHHASPLHRMVVEGELHRARSTDVQREGDILHRQIMALAAGYVEKDDPSGVMRERIHWMASFLPEGARGEVAQRMSEVAKPGSLQAALAPTLAKLHDYAQGSRRAFGSYEAKGVDGSDRAPWLKAPERYMPAGVAAMSYLLRRSQSDASDGYELNAGIAKRGREAVAVDKVRLAKVQTEEESIRKALEMEAANGKPRTKEEWDQRLLELLGGRGADLRRPTSVIPRVAGPSPTAAEKSQRLHKLLENYE